jgi:hypothetical protein
MLPVTYTHNVYCKNCACLAYGKLNKVIDNSKRRGKKEGIVAMQRERATQRERGFLFPFSLLLFAFKRNPVAPEADGMCLLIFHLFYGKMPSSA